MSFNLKLNNISKAYASLMANNSISIELSEGKIHALLGENGAGKSTLVKIIYGILKADSGIMEINGIEFSPRNPSSARSNGIGMVFQHFSLFPNLSVLENIMLGIDYGITKSELNKRIKKVSAEYGLYVDSDRLLGTLSVGEKQRVEIIRCLLQDPKLIIMDEPTSVLSPQEIKSLFLILRQLASEGRSILYISHKLEEIKLLCSEATILKDGIVVSRCDPRKETVETLAKMMIGKRLVKTRKNTTRSDKKIINISNLSYVNSDSHGCSLKNISFEIRENEIFGIAGIAGNGQKELVDLLSGEISLRKSNKIIYLGKDLHNVDINERRKLGIAVIPEERMGHSAIPNFTLSENSILTGLWSDRFIKNGFIDEEECVSFAKEIIEKFDVKTLGEFKKASSLSGGNLQKFVVGRELLQKPNLLIADQPTWGVDAGSAEMIHRLLIEHSYTSSGILVVSQDIDELIKITSRIAVLSNGQLSESYNTEDVTSEILGMEMGGARNS